MAKHNLGVDALGQMVGLGDLVVSSVPASYGSNRRCMVRGIVAAISPKSQFKLLDENGDIIGDRMGNATQFRPNYTTLIVHADEVDNYLRSIIDWEDKNTEKAGN